jgi:hypothetical protein
MHTIVTGMLHGLARGTSSLDFGSPFTHEETSV